MRPDQIQDEAPVLHLNGSAGEALADTYRTAVEKLSEAYEALQATAPHDRDYYVKQDPDALKIAMHLHTERLRRVREVLNDTKRLYYAVREQMIQRGRQKV